MKNELNSLEIACIVRELQHLVGNKVSKISQTRDELYFQFFKSGGGKSLLRITPSLLYLASMKPPAEPLNFCMFLRKRLENSILAKIEQKDYERIVLFTFKEKEKEYTLVVELFGDGNIILCDEKMIIISPMKIQQWKDRKIVPKENYLLPPSKTPELLKLKPQELLGILEKSGRPLIKRLAADLGLGNLVAEEICKRAHLEKEEKKIKLEDCEKIILSFRELFHSPIHALCTKETVLPFEFQSRAEDEKTFFNSFNEAVDFFIQRQEETEESAESTIPYTKEKARIETMMRIQASHLETIQKEVEEYTKKAELIYTHYSFVQEILETIRNARDKKVPWEEIKEKLGKKGIEVIPEKGKVIVALEGS